MTSDERDVALVAIRAYFNSRTRAIAPISLKRAIWGVRRIVGEGPSHAELTTMISEVAASEGVAIAFDADSGHESG